MKVLIVGNYVNDRQISINRFVGLVEKGLRQKGHEIRRHRPTWPALLP